MEPLQRLTSRTVVLLQPNIDTDQIIPARFLKVTGRSGLGGALFSDWRYDAQGRPNPSFALNRPESDGAKILVAGDNFGCGSSREHAPWALVDFGFRAVVSSSIADIFASNAVKNGLLPVRVSADVHRQLLVRPGAQVTLDLEARTVALEQEILGTFPIDPFARYCLMNGVDELGFLLDSAAEIARYEEGRS